MRWPSARSSAAAMAPLALPQPKTITWRQEGWVGSTLRRPSARSTSGPTFPAASAARQIACAAARGASAKSAELLESLSRLLQHVVGLRKAEPDLGAAELGVSVERRARHGGDAALLDQPHRKGVVVVHARRLHEVSGVGQDVVRAGGLPRHEARALDVAP